MIARGFIHAWSRSLSQIALSDRPSDGFLVLTATAAVAPYAALGAAIGALAGTFAGAMSEEHRDQDWEQGITGVNPAIVGIIWGGPLSLGRSDMWLFALALLLTVPLDRIVRKRLSSVGLAPLATTAVLAGWCCHWVYQSFGVSFWVQHGVEPLGAGSVVVSAALIAIVLARTSVACCLLAVTLAAVAASVTGAIWGAPLGAPELWAFSVVPAVAAPFVLLKPKPSAAFTAALVGAVGAALLWAAWTLVLGSGLLPPLLAPAIAATWIATAIVTRDGGARTTDPAVWRVVQALDEARMSGKSVVVLTGAGVSTASGIPDYVSGAWLDPRVPVTNFGFAVFKASRKCRTAYWDACEKFRRTAKGAIPGPPHVALAAMEERGFVSAVITQNVDRLHQRAGSRSVVELHGNIFDMRCLKCHRTEPWADGTDWHAGDVTCAQCGGLVKPAVIAFGEDIHPRNWRKATEAVSGCGLLLVVGTQLTVSSAVHLVGMARRHGATIVFVNDRFVSHAIMSDDLVVMGRSEQILPAMSWLLGGDPPFWGPQPAVALTMEPRVH